MKQKNVCVFCRNELGDNSSCRHCGAVRYTGFGSLLYTEKYGAVDVTVTLTDHFLLMQKHSSGTMATIGAASLGALGGAIGALADSALHAGDQIYTGFYDLREIKTVYYPYPLKMRKAEYVFRFVNHDDTDFVLVLMKREAKKLTDALSQVHVPMQDASMNPQDPISCHKPFIDKKTFDKRICSSAGSFVKLQAGQFVANPITGAAHETGYSDYSGNQYENNLASHIQVVCPNCKRRISPESKFCEYCGAPISVAKKKICPNCGAEVQGVFCSNCGVKYVEPKEAHESTGEDDATWKSAVTDPDKWECGLCGTMNAISQNKCSLCGSERSQKTANAQQTAPQKSALTGFYMTVTDVFYITGAGVVACGIVKGGSLRKGCKVRWDYQSESKSAAVIGINIKQSKAEEAHIGDNVGLLLGNISKNDISKGCFLREA